MEKTTQEKINQYQIDIKAYEDQIKLRKDFLNKESEKMEDEKRRLEYLEYDIIYTQDKIDLLIANMEFQFIGYGDMVSVGADGKRPFGNSNVSGDIISLLSLNTPKYEYQFGKYEYTYVFQKIAKRINERLKITK